MYASEYRIFDVVNAASDRTLELEVRSGIGANGAAEACEITQMASDGVYFASEMRVRSFVILLPATRQSIAIRCSSVGSFWLQSYANPSRSPVDQEVRVTQGLLKLVVHAAGSAPGALVTALPSSAEFSSIRRPAYLDDLRGAHIDSNASWAISVDQTGAADVGWLGIGSACPLPCFGRGDCDALVAAGGSIDPVAFTAGTCVYEPFGGSKGIATSAASLLPYSHVSLLGVAEELTIWGRGITPHPVHVHVNHLQLISYTPPPGSASGSPSLSAFFGEPGDWRDTWPALAGSSVLRWLPSSFGGELMIHCHYLKHEDTGMMSSIRILEPGVDGEAYDAAVAARVAAAAAAAAGSSSTASVHLPSSSTAVCDLDLAAPPTVSASITVFVGTAALLLM